MGLTKKYFNAALTRLIDKGLIVAVKQPNGDTRFFVTSKGAEVHGDGC
jgi:hypothetical protein